MPSHEISAAPRNVARAVVIKNEDIFFLAEKDGGVPAGNPDGFGLYYHDCRYLDGYEVRIAGTMLNALMATADRGSVAEFELTNEQFGSSSGESIPQQTFGITLQRAIDSSECAVHDRWSVQNYDVKEHTAPLSFTFHSGFEDIFEIRGLHPRKIGKANQPRWEKEVLVLSYEGADGVNRRLEVHIDPGPTQLTPSGANFVLTLGAGQRAQINVSLRLVESKQKPEKPHRHASDPASVVHASDRQSKDWLSGRTQIKSSDPLLNGVMHRCLLDLWVLRSSLDEWSYISAGLPWYGALFGRDSMIAALQTLAYEPAIAEQTLRLLAKYQGKNNNEWRDEQPGKILHELRRGELANLNEIPQTPYYGSVDSTPLFLILIGEHAHWTGSLQLFNELRPNIETALRWIDTDGDEAKNGYLSYATKSSKGLGNQGWKDSGDSIMNADGSLARPPIALAEVQGYVYRAKLLMADLYTRSGDDPTASKLRTEAEELKTRFNRDFWLDDQNFYAIALQKDNRQAAVISSNPGQALWTGIIEKSMAGSVVRRLTADDMYSGWGIRTLSVKERRANPIGYHLGTVWPHDNSIIAAGFRLYGFDDQAVQVMDGILEAASHFEHYRLPEVFAGFSRQQFAVPVRYPVACHPQAWAAGSVPFMLSSLLGLTPDAFNGHLRVTRPVLPRNVSELELRELKVGEGSVDLRFRRTERGVVQVDVLKQDGITVNVEPEQQPKAA
ncbi:MAG TPA: glycogen debranching N-terminal domain-containing protein [Candidatus Angelobacter sp.]|nr:glycogen debranching N-terminal domain-containing protein [Candidatus Angelobacter sp.]